jgi:hypothetical protein
VLMSIYEHLSDKYRRLDYSNPQFLRWNGEGKPKPYVKKTLPHGGPQYVDLLFTELQSGQVEVILTDQHYTRVGLTTEKTYQFFVQATASDAKSATICFDVQIGHSYDDIVIYRFVWVQRARAMFRHISARLLRRIGEDA